jgi:hypothetical protein
MWIMYVADEEAVNESVEEIAAYFSAKSYGQ